MNLYIVFTFMGWTILMGLASYLRGDFSDKQMIKRSDQGCKRPWGWSCLSHAGMWGDLLLIPWLAGIIASYYAQWTLSACAWLGFMAFLITFLMHCIWAHSGDLDHNIAKKDTLTVAGWLHLIFMSAMLTLVLLFYFATKDVSPTHMTWVTILLGLHTTLSTAVLEWCRKGHPTFTGIGTAIVVWAVLLWQIY